MWFCDIILKSRYFIIIGLITVYFFSTNLLLSQTLKNFSGKWEFDKSKSTLSKLDVDFDGTIILEIIHNKKTFSFSELYKKQGQPDWKTSFEVFNLDGKEEVINHDNGISKKSTKILSDLGTITLHTVDTQELKGKKENFYADYTYTLSDDNKTLTINIIHNNPITGELRSTKVYHRK